MCLVVTFYFLLTVLFPSGVPALVSGLISSLLVLKLVLFLHSLLDHLFSSSCQSCVPDLFPAVFWSVLLVSVLSVSNRSFCVNYKFHHLLQKVLSPVDFISPKPQFLLAVKQTQTPEASVLISDVTIHSKPVLTSVACCSDKMHRFRLHVNTSFVQSAGKLTSDL